MINATRSLIPWRSRLRRMVNFSMNWSCNGRGYLNRIGPKWFCVFKEHRVWRSAPPHIDWQDIEVGIQSSGFKISITRRKDGGRW